MTYTKDWRTFLNGVPRNWKLIPLDGAKRPICPRTGRLMSKWNDQEGYNVEGICHLNSSYVEAIGVLHGPRSGGLFVLDADGPNAGAAFRKLFKRDWRALPKGPRVDSGRPGHWSQFFWVGECWWDKLLNKKGFFAPGVEEAEKADLELFWNRTQSVIAGAHPNKKGDGRGFYEWSLTPAQFEIPEAPFWLIEPLLKAELAKSTKEFPATLDYDVYRAKKIVLEGLQPANNYSDYWTWLEVGMELHWLSCQYEDPKMLFEVWSEWSSWMNNYDLDECRLKWKSFGKSSHNERTFRSLVRRSQEVGFLLPSYTEFEKTKKKKIDKHKKKTPQDFVQFGKNAVEQLEDGWEKISEIDRPSERCAAFAALQKEIGLKDTEFKNVVRELLEELNEDNEKYGNFDAVMNADLGAISLVDRLIARSRVTLLGAEGGSGKSTAAYNIAEAVSNGGKVFNQLQAEQGNVLIYQCDEPPADAQLKWKRMGLNPDRSRFQIQWSFSPSMLPDLKRRIDKEMIALVILDSLTTIYAGGDAGMNDAEIGLHMYRLNKLASQTGAAILLTHHLKKPSTQKRKEKKTVSKNDFFGSAFIMNGVSDAWGMWNAGENFGQPVYCLRYLKHRGMLMPANHTWQLKGDETTLRFDLETNIGASQSLDNVRNMEEKVLVFLQINRSKWFTVASLANKIPNSHDGYVKSGNTKTLGNVMSRLYDRRQFTAIDRRQARTSGSGRPGWEYSIS